MPSTSASASRRPSAPVCSARASSAEATGPAGWMIVFRWVSSKSKVCEVMPLISAALAMSTRSPRPSSVAWGAGRSMLTAARAASAAGRGGGGGACRGGGRRALDAPPGEGGREGGGGGGMAGVLGLQRAAPEGGERVGDLAPGDVGRRAVHRLEDGGRGALRIDVAGG